MAKSTAPPEPAKTKRTTSRQFGRIAMLLCAVALYALLIDAAVETWQSTSALRLWIAGPIALYVSFTLWLVQQGSSHRPTAASSVWLSVSVFLAVVAFSVSSPEGLNDGVRVAAHGTSDVLVVSAVVVVALALVSLFFISPLGLIARTVAALAACYSIYSLIVGLQSRTSYVQMLQGAAWYPKLPYYLQGPFVGSLIVVPIALLVEIFVAMARLKVRGRLHRIVVFILGMVIAYSAVTVR